MDRILLIVTKNKFLLLILKFQFVEQCLVHNRSPNMCSNNIYGLGFKLFTVFSFK